MTENEFQGYIKKYAKELEEIKESAHTLHEHVNQHYDKVHPYGFHLDMVTASVFKYGHLVCQEERDVLPLFFGAYYHDSIEDARLTYNDVNKIAHRWMGDRQSYMAAEIVYALTNDKGRTRAERAGEKYYQGIRETPYAPFVKLADRLANITYSCSNSNDSNEHMRTIYRMELPHFLESLSKVTNDPRLLLPDVMVDAMLDLVIEKPGNLRVMKK
ncbi:MAG: hypothetical protein IKQ62_05105 [Bacteroidaceae bacterium]|nr:hypothetical protein [Bacteroidaceae bacterium]